MRVKIFEANDKYTIESMVNNFLRNVKYEDFIDIRYCSNLESSSYTLHSKISLMVLLK